MEIEVPKSSFHRLVKPEYSSKIPPHLLVKLDEKERWTMEALAKLDFKADWLVDKTIEANDQQIDLDVRVKKVEQWKAVLSGKWALIGAVGLMVFTALLSAGAKSLFEHFLKRP